MSRSVGVAVVIDPPVRSRRPTANRAAASAGTAATVRQGASMARAGRPTTASTAGSGRY